jgi:4a-hydroxytetrahydrobiopterin dehydratase
MAAASLLSEARSGSKLAEQACVSCVSKGGDLQVLSPEDVKVLMGQLCPSWAVVDENRALEKKFTAKNFVSAMAALQGFGEVAEAAGHHPDLSITNYRDVTVRFSTHGLGGFLSINDFVVAAKLDQVPVTYSPKWEKDHPEVISGKAKAASG